MKQILLPVLVLLTIASCGTSKKETKTSKTEVSKKEATEMTNNVRIHDVWGLTKLLDKDNSKKIQIEFDTKEQTFNGTDGCNTISGAITKLDGNTIELGDASGTRMACEDMETPAQYQALLKQVKHYNIKDLNLYLLDEDKKVLLTFKKID